MESTLASQQLLPTTMIDATSPAALLDKPAKASKAATAQPLSTLATLCALVQSPTVRKYTVQFVFLFTGVFSTCAAQFVFYQGAGDQKAMLLPLCNYLGIMLVGLIPLKSAGGASAKREPEPALLASPASSSGVTTRSSFDAAADEDADEPERTTIPLLSESMELTRRQAGGEHAAADDGELDVASAASAAATDGSAPAIQVTPSAVSFSFSQLQLCIFASVVLDFAGCIFSTIGLSMAGSGLYQVVYSSVICWSALFSRIVLKKRVSREEWMGIALVTFGLAFSALGGSSDGRNSYVVLMGCFNTLVGAAFYGGNYVAGEYTLKLPERPEPKELCLKLGASCVAVIAVYQSVFVLPEWHELVTKPIAEANGSTSSILTALIGYTLSQLAHGLTYFMMLGSSGAVTTGIMQSLRAVCVFAISSLLYCSHQESQCFDTRRGVATLIVVSGVMFYSWAKSQAKAPAAPTPSSRKQKMVAGKNYVV